MPHDPVPGLLARATETLEAEFASFPRSTQPPAAAATPQAIAEVLERRRIGWATTTPTSILSMPARCSSRPIRWREPPMRWP